MSKMGQSFLSVGNDTDRQTPRFDVGPVAELWLLVVYIQMVRAAMKEDPVTVQRSGSEKSRTDYLQKYVCRREY